MLILDYKLDWFGHTIAALLWLTLRHSVFGCKSGHAESQFTEMVTGQFDQRGDHHSTGIPWPRQKHGRRTLWRRGRSYQWNRSSAAEKRWSGTDFYQRQYWNVPANDHNIVGCPRWFLLRIPAQAMATDRQEPGRLVRRRMRFVS